MRRPDKIKRLNAVMPPDPKTFTVRPDAGGGEWVVKNSRGVTVASGFDSPQEARNYITRELA